MVSVGKSEIIIYFLSYKQTVDPVVCCAMVIFKFFSFPTEAIAFHFFFLLKKRLKKSHIKNRAYKTAY